MAGIELYRYQQKIINRARENVKNGITRFIIKAPTGAGKTVIFSYLCSQIQQNGMRAIILSNRKELQGQSGGTLEKFGVAPGSVLAGAKHPPTNQIISAMAPTIKNRLKIPLWLEWFQGFEVVIIDECHLQDFDFVFEYLLDHQIVIGATATPRRTGSMRQLGYMYEDIINEVSTMELVGLDYLVKDLYYGVDNQDFDSIEFDRSKGDYKTGDLFKRFNAPKLYAGVLYNWLTHAKDSHTIIFCVNIEHSIRTCIEFREAGIDARYLVSKPPKPKPYANPTPGQAKTYQEKLKVWDLYDSTFQEMSGKRDDLISKYKTGGFPVLVNSGICTTGFDCSRIETVIVNRATLSSSLWYQMIGRGSRIHPGKDHFKLMDFGGNANRLGRFMDSPDFGLWHVVGREGGLAPIKSCGITNTGNKIINHNGGCERLIPASFKICPFCGFQYPDKKALKVALKAMELNCNERYKKPMHEMDDRELEKYIDLKGYRKTFFWIKLYERGGLLRIEQYGSRWWSAKATTSATNYCANMVANNKIPRYKISV